MEDAELRTLVKQLRDAGHSLNEILDALHKEHDVHVTFLELRMLVAEIEKNQPVGKPKKEAEKPAEEAPGGTTVEIDQIVQPGMQLSGTASLPSGAKIRWFVDPTSRLTAALDPGSSKPTEEDMKDFQRALGEKLQRGS